MINPIQLNLAPDTDLLESLKNVAIKEQKLGYILSIVGDLSEAKIKCPGKKTATIIKDHLEIIAMNGTISPEKCHLHLSVSDGNCNLWAGHLDNGTIILKGADILIGFLEEHFKQETSYAEKKTVDIYILPNCPWSSRAVRMLRTLQISHQIKVIESESEFKELNKISNYSTFPQIFINGEFIGGYTELAELHASGTLGN